MHKLISTFPLKSICFLLDTKIKFSMLPINRRFVLDSYRAGAHSQKASEALPSGKFCEVYMSFFCHQVSYTSDAWTRVIENSEDRFEAIRVPIERIGGQFRAAFFTTGRFDVLAITQFPDHITPADISTAFAQGGAVASIQTIPLLTANQAIEAQIQAKQSPHHSFPRARRTVAAIAGS